MASRRRELKGPAFIQYFDPIIRALKELGGSGGPPEVIPLVAKIKDVPESEQQVVLKSGRTRFDRFVQWARQYLVWEGLVDGSVRGVWSLTDAGWKIDSISHEEALEIFERQYAAHKRKMPSKAGKELTATADHNMEDEDEEDAQVGEEDTSHYGKVLDVLRKMTPTGFEHFCVRLLREHGFEGLAHQGGPGDKGIDGQGTLRINPFVSISVVFQCKRYQAKSTVTASEISAFRGSIPNSVDKGIFITSSDFTAQARSTARASDKKPIELISGSDIVRLMEERSLGLRQVYDIDKRFFDDFEFES
jgi:restriction system protein